ncbi:MAG: UDP-N-acetylmuramoyl-tripeptide--D-alanyl-D-alanine ligase [Nocardioidaceae bacterium]
MIPIRLDDIAGITGGVVDGEGAVIVTGPAFVDSREVVAGGLFVAVPGEHVDGHDFAGAAVRAGAAAVLASRSVGAPAVVVPDPVAALGLLAREVIGRLPGCQVTAITGSQGKTGTKDLLAQVLARHGTTTATSGNANNEIGVPLTGLRATPDTRHLVVEMGARGVGHIAYLCSLVPPRIGCVLNVGVAHVGEFGSREAIATAKSELVAALPPDGVAVLNADDPLVSAMAERTQAAVLTFGRHPDADVRLTRLSIDDLGQPRFRLAYDRNTVDVALPLLGEHQAINAAAAAAAALASGMALPAVGAALRAADSLSHWRMERHVRGDGVVVVNDAYNANPDSMRAALTTLATLGANRGARTIAVLGEMLELGDTADDEHAEIGRLVVRLGITQLLAVGEQARPLQVGASLEGAADGRCVLLPDVESSVRWLRSHLRPGDVVLVKASRAVGLERVAAALLGDSGDTASGSTTQARNTGEDPTG